MADLSRRKVLSAGVAAGVSGLAGCLDSFVEADDSPDEEQSADDGETDPSTSGGIQVTNVETETVDSACRTDEQEGSEQTIEGDSVEITGTLFTSTPCHVATAEASVSGSTLSVAVAGEPEDDERECAQCLARVEYQIQVRLSEAGIETVDVTHGADSTQGAGTTGSDGASDTMGSDTENDVEMTVQTIETGQATCARGEEQVSASRQDSTLSLNGVVQAPNPCHEAVVSEITTTDGMQTVNIGVESTLGEDEMCQQCLGHVSYQVTLSGVDTAGNEEIRVQHSSGFSTTV